MRGLVHAAQIQIAPPITTANGTIFTAACNEVRSESAPMRGGESTSSRTCMANTLNAMAEARSVAVTRLAMAALIGPVERNNKSWPATMHARYRCGDCVVSAAQTKGAAIRQETADSHRYACCERLAK